MHELKSPSKIALSYLDDSESILFEKVVIYGATKITKTWATQIFDSIKICYTLMKKIPQLKFFILCRKNNLTKIYYTFQESEPNQNFSYFI